MDGIHDDLELARWLRRRNGSLLAALVAAGRDDLVGELLALLGTTREEFGARVREELARREAAAAESN
jgi:hypothetical protein